MRNVIKNIRNKNIICLIFYTFILNDSSISIMSYLSTYQVDIYCYGNK